MRKGKTCLALDVGTTKVACLVGRKGPSEQMEILGFGVAPSGGIEKGEVVEPSEFARSVRTAVREALAQVPEPIGNAYVGISGSTISSIRSHGEISLSPESLQISPQDVASVLEVASASIPPHQELLHVIPQSYVVDDGEAMKDPVGANGTMLGVEANLVFGDSSHVKAVTRAVEMAQVKVDALVFNPIATGLAVLQSGELEREAVVIDIGGSTTDVAVFQRGSFRHAFTLPVGGYHISNDSAIWLGTTFQVAEDMKLRYGCADPQAIASGETLQVARYLDRQVKEVQRRDLCHVMQERLEEMMAIVTAKVEEMGYLRKQWGGVLLTGGGAKLPGLESMARAFFRVPVRLGAPLMFRFGPDELKDPSWSACAGVLLWAAIHADGSSPFQDAQGRQATAGTVLRVWMKDIIPT